MIKVLIKIVIALLIAHAAWQVGSSYWKYYQFQDGLQQLAQFGERRTTKQLCEQAVEAAHNAGVPVTAEAIVIQRVGSPPWNCETGPTSVPPGVGAPGVGQIGIDAVYMDQIRILPGYDYPWQFRPSVRAFSSAL